MYIYHVSYFGSGSSNLSGTDAPSTTASETKVLNKNNETNINSIAAIDDSELPIRFRRAAILTDEIQYIEVCLPQNIITFDLTCTF